MILVSNPFAIASGNIAMRSMRKLHESVVSCWMNLSMICIFVPAVYLSGHDFSICNEFGIKSCVLLIFDSVSVTFS